MTGKQTGVVNSFFGQITPATQAGFGVGFNPPLTQAADARLSLTPKQPSAE